ncbi:alpha-L-rhamnosidase OS=Streptomyces griseorubiginosus OX=67304 GN=AQJ54_19195 PE=4 SV=1 [Streptomyces griseorubiginosus]
MLWNSARNEYRSPGYNGDTDDRANGLAVVAGLAPASRHRAVTEVLRTHLNASPYMEFYVLEALYLMGAATVAEERMRNRYAAQVADPACYTLWEIWDKSGGTDNHAWNGGPLYVMSAYAAGVRPTKPGWETYDVVPQTGTLTKVSTVTPTVKGDIRLDITRDGSQVTLALTSPGATTARVGVPTYGGSSPVIKANGTTVFTGGAATGSVSGLSYASKDSAYVYFTLQPGTWTFTVTGAGRLDDLALGRPVTSNSSLENSDWGKNRLTDGKLASVSGAKGYTSIDFPSADVSANPVWVEIDLGADTDLDAVRLFPRTDTPAVGGGTAGFPVDFTIQTRPDGSGTYTTVRTVTAEPNPGGLVQTYGLQNDDRALRAPPGHQARDPSRRRDHQVPPPAGRTHRPHRRDHRHRQLHAGERRLGQDPASGRHPHQRRRLQGFHQHRLPLRRRQRLTVVDRGRPRRRPGHRIGHPAPPHRHGRRGRGHGGLPGRLHVPDPHRRRHHLHHRPHRHRRAQPERSRPDLHPHLANGRYLRLKVTRLGKPASDESTRYRLQLAEIRIK